MKVLTLTNSEILGFIIQQGHQLVKKCSLGGAKHIIVDERIYCANKYKSMNYTRAVEHCEKLNATLPLPTSLLEFEIFSNFTGPNKVWIDITDSSKSGKKENWRDAQNKQPAYVKSRVKIFEAICKTYTYFVFFKVVVKCFLSGQT